MYLEQSISNLVTTFSQAQWLKRSNHLQNYCPVYEIEVMVARGLPSIGDRVKGIVRALMLDKVWRFVDKVCSGVGHFRVTRYRGFNKDNLCGKSWSLTIRRRLLARSNLGGDFRTSTTCVRRRNLTWLSKWGTSLDSQGSWID